MRTILQRNNIWNSDVQHILSNTVEKCEHYIATAPPPSNRKVSIAGINPHFIDLICVDRFYIDELRLFHVMDTY